MTDDVTYIQDYLILCLPSCNYTCQEEEMNRIEDGGVNWTGSSQQKRVVEMKTILQTSSTMSF